MLVWVELAPGRRPDASTRRGDGRAPGQDGVPHADGRRGLGDRALLGGALDLAADPVAVPNAPSTRLVRSRSARRRARISRHEARALLRLAAAPGDEDQGAGDEAVGLGHDQRHASRAPHPNFVDTLSAEAWRAAAFTLIDSPAVTRGQPFGRYELLSRISAGGMAEVFLALHVPSGTNVALKRILPEVAEDEEFVEDVRGRSAHRVAARAPVHRPLPRLRSRQRSLVHQLRVRRREGSPYALRSLRPQWRASAALVPRHGDEQDRRGARLRARPPRRERRSRCRSCTATFPRRTSSCRTAAT
jgi:hypothetical protein